MMSETDPDGGVPDCGREHDGELLRRGGRHQRRRPDPSPGGHRTDPTRPGRADRRQLGPVVPPAKAEGAFIALAAGDALGWPQEMPRRVRGGTGGGAPSLEFQSWTRRSGGGFGLYDETIGAGEYSDDTQLALAVARCRAGHGEDWWKAWVRMELPRWTLYERGGGGATKRAARAWRAGAPPWLADTTAGLRRYFGAGGNGVAARVLPHALFLAGNDDPAVLVHDVVRDGVATHGHPGALVGATVSAFAAWSLARRRATLRFGELLDLLMDERRAWGTLPDRGRGAGAWFAAAGRAFGEPYEEVWRRAVEEMRALLDKARRGIRAGALADDRAVLDDLGCFGACRGAGAVAAAAAAYLAARHAAQPAQGVLRAAFEPGADTDTLAAMTGGLLGCLAGDEWLPAPWRRVQDSAYLRSLAGRVALGPSAYRESVEAPALRAILADLEWNVDHEVSLGGGMLARATALPDLKPISKSITVRAWRLRTREGQALYVTRVEKPKARRDARPRVTASRQGSAHADHSSAARRGRVAADAGPGHAGDHDLRGASPRRRRGPS